MQWYKEHLIKFWGRSGSSCRLSKSGIEAIWGKWAALTKEVCALWVFVWVRIFRPGYNLWIYMVHKTDRSMYGMNNDRPTESYSRVRYTGWSMGGCGYFRRIHWTVLCLTYITQHQMWCTHTHKKKNTVRQSTNNSTAGWHLGYDVLVSSAKPHVYSIVSL